MSALNKIIDLNGKWQGTKHLWLSPEAPARNSQSTAKIHSTAQGQFTEIRYTWADEGKPQEGRLILGLDTQQKVVKAVWFDTWHLSEQFMVCEGRVDDHGGVNIQGTYAAPGGPDWGWQIRIEPKDQDQFALRMYNIAPQGEKMLAVEINYSRKG